MYLGVPVYLDRGDYIFQSTGPYYTSWVPEDHDPEWYLDKIVEDNQGNLAVIWDGRCSRYQLKSKAFLLDLEDVGIKVPDPDWENGKYLIPEDFEPCMTMPERLGAGFYRFVRAAEERGLYCSSIYTDATPEWTQKIVSSPVYIGYNVGEAFSFGSGFCTAKRADGTPDYTLKTAAADFGASISGYLGKLTANGWKTFLITSGSFH